jgi:hypothetical protein
MGKNAERLQSYNHFPPRIFRFALKIRSTQKRKLSEPHIFLTLGIESQIHEI